MTTWGHFTNHYITTPQLRVYIKLIGGRFDYDICVTDACWGANSNTVQNEIHRAMGSRIQVPKGINLPGINGQFFDGPIDNYFQKVGAELQKEQP